MRIFGDTASARDPWDNPIRFERLSYAPAIHVVRSAGPDKRFDTADDFSVNMRLSQAGPSRIDLAIESDRGPDNGRAEITGSVTDSFGAIVPGATIRAGTRIATNNANGRFTLSTAKPDDGAMPGEYAVTLDEY